MSNTLVDEKLNNSPPTIEDLYYEILELRKDMKLVLNELKELKGSCSRMDGHIDFVENVYDTVRKPVSYLLSYTNRWKGKQNEEKELPLLHSSLPSVLDKDKNEEGD